MRIDYTIEIIFFQIDIIIIHIFLKNDNFVFDIMSFIYFILLTLQLILRCLRFKHDSLEHGLNSVYNPQQLRLIYI